MTLPWAFPARCRYHVNISTFVFMEGLDPQLQIPGIHIGDPAVDLIRLLQEQVGVYDHRRHYHHRTESLTHAWVWYRDRGERVREELFPALPPNPPVWVWFSGHLHDPRAPPARFLGFLTGPGCDNVVPIPGYHPCVLDLVPRAPDPRR